MRVVVTPPQQKATGQQLHDLMVKYEALEQKSKTMKLENIEYKQHIEEVNHYNETLQQELDEYRERMDEVDHVNPMIKHHILSIEQSLHVKDTEMHRMSDKLNQSSKLIQSLSAEILSLQEQNDKLKIALETNYKQKQSMKQIHNDTINGNENKINSLQNEVESLNEELHTLKSTQFDENKHKLETSISSHLLPPSIMANTSPFHMRIPSKLSNISRASTASSSSAVSSVQYSRYWHSAELSNMNMYGDSEYEERLQKLEEENAELIQKLVKYQNVTDDDEKCDDNKVEDIEEFDDDEIIEMEELFRKCDDEQLVFNVNDDHTFDGDMDDYMMVKSKDFIKKTVRWMIRFDYKCKYVKMGR